MYTNYNYLIPEERQAWRSAYEIEIAAHKHEERRFQILNEYAAWVTPRVQVEGGRKTGFLSFLQAPLQMLAALFG
jgi:spore maturation protein CgeB